MPGRRAWGLGAAVVCVLLAGCTLWGGSFAPHSTRPVVKIGLIAPFEQRYRTLGYEVLTAVRWAIRERNDAGGLAGTAVELVALNDNDDPTESAFQAAKLALDADVVGAVGPFSPGTLASAAQSYSASGLPAIVLATCPPAEQALDGVFCFGADADTLAQGIVDRLPAGAQVAFLRMDDGPMAAALDAAAQRVLDVPLDAAALDALKARPPDACLYEGDVLGAAGALSQMKEAGIDMPLWGGPSLARTQLAQIAGEASAGACYAMTKPAFADPLAGSAFADGYRSLSGGVPGPWAALAYEATALLLDALEREIQQSGRPTREGVQVQLQQVTAADGQTVFEGGRRRSAEVLVYCYSAGEPYPGHPLDSGGLD
jgi:branched-chain amino acid transport system substrate-binding protein